MVKHTIHYDIRNIRKAGFIAFSDDLMKIMREYWHMKRALRKIKKACKDGSLFSIAAIGSELEKKVRL